VRVLAITSRQFGVIERSQAVASGMTERMIDWRLSTGEWRILYPCVYVLRSSTPSWMQSELGAVLWAGPEAAGSGRAAGTIWGFDGIDARCIEISTTRRVRHAGVVVHRVEELGYTLTRRGTPVTDPFKTVVDLAGLIDRASLEAALDRDYGPDSSICRISKRRCPMPAPGGASRI
jgi:hypothetical protein